MQKSIRNGLKRWFFKNLHDFRQKTIFNPNIGKKSKIVEKKTLDPILMTRFIVYSFVLGKEI